MKEEGITNRHVITKHEKRLQVFVVLRLLITSALSLETFEKVESRILSKKKERAKRESITFDTKGFFLSILYSKRNRQKNTI